MRLIIISLLFVLVNMFAVPVSAQQRIGYEITKLATRDRVVCSECDLPDGYVVCRKCEPSAGTIADIAATFSITLLEPPSHVDLQIRGKKGKPVRVNMEQWNNGRVGRVLLVQSVKPFKLGATMNIGAENRRRDAFLGWAYRALLDREDIRFFAAHEKYVAVTPTSNDQTIRFTTLRAPEP